MCVIAGSRINRCFKVQVMEVTPLFMIDYIPKKKIWINCQIRGPSGALCHKRTHRTLNAVRSGNTGSTSFCSKHSISASVAHHVDHTDKCMSALWRLPAFKALTLYCSINGLSGAKEARGSVCTDTEIRSYDALEKADLRSASDSCDHNGFN